MNAILPVLAAYTPPDITRLAVDNTQVLLNLEKPQTRTFQAAVLFADVSGFTPLTEALAKKGAEGPEELTRLLNRYFTRMISLIEAEGGEVVKFSGDAVTVVFLVRDSDDSLATVTRRARQAAEAMQQAMADFTQMQTSVGRVELGMKIGIGAGEIQASWIGGVRNRWEYIISGDPLGQVAEAEHQAERGDIVLSPEAEAICEPNPQSLKPIVQPNWSQLSNPAQIEQALRNFVPGAVLVRLEEGLHSWLAELRPMSVLFIGIGGLDYAQPEAIEQLHHFLRGAQTVMYKYEGSINKVAVDDKGTIMIVLFGAPPFAHEDDAERALRCSLDLQQTAQQQDLDLAIGVTSGRVFAGPVGSDSRREYTVMGDTVNLAARLMGVAGLGNLRCDYETYRAARNKLAFEALTPVRVKGKAGLIRIYRPSGETLTKGSNETSNRLIGRQHEMETFEALLKDTQTNQGQTHCLLVEGEAGIGKSRLVEEMIEIMRENGLTGLIGMGRSIEQQTPYRAWRDVFSSYFDLDIIDDQAERERRVSDQLNDILPEQTERLPLLNEILNTNFAENELTQSLDSQLRHDSLVLLLLALLRAWAAERPLVLILEDAHWLDTLSWDLTLQVFRSLSAAQVSFFMILVMRPLEGGSMRIEPMTLASLNETIKLSLDSLSPEETVSLAAARLGLNRDQLPVEVADLIRRRADGNPFFAEEIIHTLRDSGLISVKREGEQHICLVNGDLKSAVQTLPETLEGIVLARIDRLPAEEQLTLKVAAVIGRAFAFPTLSETISQQMGISDRHLRSYLDDLNHLDLTILEAPEPELTYLFKHIITQEVAYETLLYAQRRQLHQAVAEWYERRFQSDDPSLDPLDVPLAPYYPLLVYHWHRAGNTDRELHYARLAGQWAAGQFANTEAVAYLSRAIELTADDDPAELYPLLLAREAVNDLLAAREAQAADLVALQALSEHLHDARRQAEVALRQANFFEATSDYIEALAAAEQIIENAHTAGMPAIEADGYVTQGKILWRQGNYDAALEPLERALKLSETAQSTSSEAKSLYYLGHVHLYQGDYEAAQRYYTQALGLFQEAGARQGEADSLSMLGVIYSDLGDYSAAAQQAEQALAICKTIGDLRGETIILGNMGNVYWFLGDYETAKAYHQQTLEINLIINDRSQEANSLTNLALINYSLSDYETACLNCQEARYIQEEIGDRFGLGFALSYLGLALAKLGQYKAANEAHQAAIEIRQELGQHSLVIDNVAGLAQIALEQGDFAKASAYVDQITTYLDENGTDGIEFPLQVQFIAYQVLSLTAAGDQAKLVQAESLLNQAHTSLQEQASSITDLTMRQRFLAEVATNRAILNAWASLQ